MIKKIGQMIKNIGQVRLKTYKQGQSHCQSPIRNQDGIFCGPSWTTVNKEKLKLASPRTNDRPIWEIREEIMYFTKENEPVNTQ